MHPILYKVIKHLARIRKIAFDLQGMQLRVYC